MPTFDEQMLDAEIARREAGQGGQPQAQTMPGAFDPSMMQLEASAAHDEQQQRRMAAMQASAQPTQAGISPMMPGRAPSPEMSPPAPAPRQTTVRPRRYRESDRNADVAGAST